MATFIKSELRAELERAVTNEFALLEVLQILQWRFPDNHDCFAGRALTDTIFEIEAYIEGER